MSLSQIHRTARIRALNDQFRANPETGKLAATESFLLTFGSTSLRWFLDQVRIYDNFTPGDPYAEHDNGIIECMGQTVLWQIAYADPSLSKPSADPADPQRTVRVLHLYLPDEEGG